MLSAVITVHDSEPLRAKSAFQALQVLDAFVDAPGELSFAEISRAAGIPKGSLFNVLAALVQHGYLQRNEPGGRYTTGLKCYQLGSTFVRSADFGEAASKVMRTINQLTGETVLVGVRNGSEVVVLERAQATQVIGVNIAPGSHWNLHRTAMGVALLTAEGDGTAADNGDPGDPEPIVTQDDIVFVRAGVVPGQVGVAGAIRDARARPVAAIGVALPDMRATPDYISRLSALLAAGTERVSATLGFPGARPGDSSLEQIWETAPSRA